MISLVSREGLFGGASETASYCIDSPVAAGKPIVTAFERQGLSSYQVDWQTGSGLAGLVDGEWRMTDGGENFNVAFSRATTIFIPLNQCSGRVSCSVLALIVCDNCRPNGELEL